ncbi:MAG: ABC transporter ATP-binding protein [Acidimicrobiia bacterium]|nr:ABC transporter ATP-binding protein [Acidimicrobiia bacterium]
MDNGLVLEARDLRKSFKDLHAVKGVSFHISTGETYGLLGPNGAGKTTTISMVTGLLERDAGEVTVDGQAITTTSTEPKRAIGYVPQDIAIYPDLTARENLAFFGRLYGMRANELSDRIDEVLEIIGLAERADDASEEFSGGMKRRLNIGIGLLHRPRLLMLDEPTVGVDPQSRNAILESVERLSTAGMAVLYTTHYMEEAERLCDRVGIIDEGEIKAEGTRAELVSMVGQRDEVRLAATGDLEAAVQAAGAIPVVQDVSLNDEGIEMLVDGADRALAEILGAVGTHASVTSVEVDEPNLEAVFLHLTGKALRD